MTTHDEHTHADSSDDSETFERTFDDGERLVLHDEPADGTPAAFVALDTASCTGTECQCHEVELLVQPLTLVDGELVEGDGTPLQALLDAESGEISVEAEPEPGSEEALLLARLRRLAQDETLDLLQDRWRRGRRQEDPDEWKETDWAALDLETMVPFLEIFPSRWDISVFVDGHKYWVIDFWCLTPDCPCTQVALDFLAEEDDATEHLVVDLETNEPDDPEATEGARRLWAAFRETPGALEELAARREATRRVARELPALLESE
ncbi:MAG: hypothetical protein IPP07_20585 [Holophagales bacterium]|jgi:hypothetical protein|nr:hypothetical protein [Holophagales bacterium]MBK9967146.1 hypothetical protein [Holophagales bacterium]